MTPLNRRSFLSGSIAASFAGKRAFALTTGSIAHLGISHRVLHPAARVPLSFIIDDSTCLVNMGHFCTPQFSAAFPDRADYKRPWHKWPREIPDAFVRRFGEWCAEHGVKGKYSIVPNPACVGWLDRELPGWSRQQLKDSLSLVRDLMVPNWDIHPEMITHTRVIDLKTGRPLPNPGPSTMENWYPREKKSVDELAAYLAYALRILKNCDLPCTGVTTPGGFGNMVKPELSQAAGEALRDVYGLEIPHYFKYVHTGEESTDPILESVTGRGTDQISLTMNVPAGTGDWFGGWQGANPSNGHLYSNEDATGGRMVELIKKGQPAVMLCHWPGLYSNGSHEGFEHFCKVVTSLHRRFGKVTRWMKISEMARYEAARQLTDVAIEDHVVTLKAPFAAPLFTMELSDPRLSGLTISPTIHRVGVQKPMKKVSQRHQLASGTWFQDESTIILCFDLPKGASQIKLTEE